MKTTAAPADLDSLRRKVHAEIDRMEAADLAAFGSVLQQLEIERAAEQLDEGFDGDHAAGRLSADRIREAIHFARTQHPYA